MNIRVTGIFSKETPMFDIPDEYIASTSTFTKEEFTEFLRQKQIYTYDGYKFSLDWWRLNTNVYKSYYFEKNEVVRSGLAEAMKGNIVHLAVGGNDDEQIIMLQMYHEAFAIFADEILSVLNIYSEGFFIFSEDFEAVGFCDFCQNLYINFPLGEDNTPLETHVFWRQQFHEINEGKALPEVQEHEESRVVDVRILKEAIIRHYEKEDHAMLKQLYSCVDTLNDFWIGKDSPFFSLFNDLGNWYYNRDTPGGVAEHILHYVSESQLLPEVYGEWHENAKKRIKKEIWRTTRVDYALQCLRSETPTDWEGALTIVSCNFEAFEEIIPDILTLVSNHPEKLKISLKFGYEKFYVHHIETIELQQDTLTITLVNDPENTCHNVCTNNPVTWFQHHKSQLKKLRKLSIAHHSWRSVIRSIDQHKRLEELHIDNRLNVPGNILREIWNKRPKLKIVTD